MLDTLTKKQFDLLEQLATDQRKWTQKELSEETGFSINTVNAICKAMSDFGWINSGRITETGIEMLEPYRVKRAVFLAAGFGERMLPITLSVPKPLVRVRGQRIIDGLLDAVINVGITDIYVIRGYLAEQFNQLSDKYPTIKFVDNPEYVSSNSIGSARYASKLMENAYVCESDLLLHTSKLIKKYQYSTNFLGFHTDVTDDWCFEVKNGIIQQQKIGGVDCWQEIGISYWTSKDAQKLTKHIEIAYAQPGGHALHWEALPFKQFASEYKIRLRECACSDVTEIDTYQELKAYDPAYVI